MVLFRNLNRSQNKYTFLMRIQFAVLALFVVILFACTSTKESPSDVIPDPIVLQAPEPFINGEDEDLMLVFYLNILHDGTIAVADPGLMKIVVFDTDGTEQYRFGSEGRGPAEITEITSFFEYNDHIYIGDRTQARLMKYSNKGEFISFLDYTTHRGSYGQIAMVDTMSYVSASMGENGTLLKWYRPSTDSTSFWGQAFGDEYVFGDLTIQNDILKKGEIPPSTMNNVILTSDKSHVYTFLTTHGVVQQYDLNGNLNWQTEVKLPINDYIFQDAVRRANELTMPGVAATFSLASGFKVIDGNVYILSNYVEKLDRSLVKISSDGLILAHYQIPATPNRYFDFTIDPKTEILYLAAPESGEIYHVSLNR